MIGTVRSNRRELPAAAVFNDSKHANLLHTDFLFTNIATLAVYKEQFQQKEQVNRLHLHIAQRGCCTTGSRQSEAQAGNKG